MKTLAEKRVVVPHWHIPLVMSVTLASGFLVDSFWLTGIGLFYAGLQCSIMLPIWIDAKSEKDTRYLDMFRGARAIRFWYWFVPGGSILLACIALVTEFVLKQSMV